MVAALYALGAASLALALHRAAARRRRGQIVRFRVEPYRNDRAGAEQLLASLTALHSLLAGDTRLDLRARRGLLALVVHLDRREGGAPIAWFAVCGPARHARQIEAALRASYPNLVLRVHSSAARGAAGARATAPSRSHASHELAWLRSARSIRLDLPAAMRLLRAMAAAGPPASVQLVLRPAAAPVESLLAGRHDREAPAQPPRALFWAQARVFAADRGRARGLARALCGGSDQPRLVPGRLVRRPSSLRGIARTPSNLYALEELTELWQLPTPDFSALPCLRRALPLAPAPPGIARPTCRTRAALR